MHTVLNRVTENWQAVVLVAVWMVAHILIVVPLIKERWGSIAILFIGILLALCYLIKPFTYDLPKYSLYFDYSSLAVEGYTRTSSGEIILAETDRDGPFCPFGSTNWGSKGFCTTIALSRQVMPKGSWLLPRMLPGPYVSDSLMIVVVLIGLGCMLIAVKFLFDEISRAPPFLSQLLYAIPFLLGSTFFFVGSQNSVRQFLAIVMILSAIGLAFANRRIWALIFSVGALTMHQWGWMLIMPALLGILWVGLLEKYHEKLRGREILATVIFPLGLGVIGVGVLTATASIFQDNHFWGELGTYLTGKINDDPFRSNVVGKVGFIGLMFLASEWVIGKVESRAILRVQWMRRILFFLILPLAYYEAIFSRLLYLYFGLETLLIIGLWMLGDLRRRIAAGIIFISYSLTPNVLRILVGLSNWKALLYG
jgi:hypothetical protein